MASGSLPSEYPLPARRFKSIELLRFLMAWAVVLFHIANGTLYDDFGLSFLEPYVGGRVGDCAVSYFFLISFFFLVLKTRPDCSVWSFVRNRWLRMAPLIIAAGLLGYLMYLCGLHYGKWYISADVETMLLIHDTVPWDRWEGGPAWFCSVLFLCSLFYLAWVKTLSARVLPLVIFAAAFIGMEAMRLQPQFPDARLVFLNDYGRPFLCLGIAYLIASMYVAQVSHQISPDGSNKPRYSSAGTAIRTSVEIVLMGIFLCSLFGSKWYRLSTLLSILAFAGLFFSFVRGGGMLSRLLERDWCVWLGRYAFGIFIVHKLVLRMTKSIIPAHQEWVSAHPWVLLVGIVSVTMLLAVVGYHFVEMPVARYIKSKT